MSGKVSDKVLGKLRVLFQRYAQGIATQEERAELMDLIHDASNDQELKSVMDEQWSDFHGSSDETKLDPKRADVIFNSLLEAGRHRQKEIAITPNRRIIYYRAAAAIGVILISVTALVFYQKSSELKTIVQSSVIVPGGNKAILQLSDGRRIELDSLGTSSLPKQGATSIVNNAGQLSYTANHTTTGSRSEPLFNRISTPRGGKYQLQLSDGSKVWLNAVSSLQYPAAFSGNDRVVELTGEAYFEIAKNERMPFRVRLTSGAEVEVLGTHFNVMAYDEEKIIKTTLLEGSVKISSEKIKGAILSPNQQAQIFSDGKLTLLKNYDVSQAVAWKNDTFLFDDTRLETIMRQVARWYDIEVVYEGDENYLRSIQFGGKVSRKANASEVLNLLKLTGAVDFEVQGRKIIVRKNKGTIG